MLYLFFSLIAASSQAQSLFPENMLLSELPHGARLKVTNYVEMGTITDDQHAQDLHYCTFEDGKCTPAYDSGIMLGLGVSYNTQVNVRTDVESALTEKGAGTFTSGTYFLNAGTYCLDRNESSFRSNTDDRTDKLRLTDCSGNAVFTLYVRAGYNLRNRDGFRGFSVGDFHFQSGKVLRWLK